MSDSSRPHGLQPTRLFRPWDFPGKSTGVGCHCLLCQAGPPDPNFPKVSCKPEHFTACRLCEDKSLPVMSTITFLPVAAFRAHADSPAPHNNAAEAKHHTWGMKTHISSVALQAILHVRVEKLHVCVLRGGASVLCRGQLSRPAPGC